MNYFRDFFTFCLRIALVYACLMVCRVVFYCANAQLIGPLGGENLWLMLKGALAFDSASVFYINLPFLFFSLIPFRFRQLKGYQKFLFWLFVIVNTAGLLLAVADIFYYPFKLSRITFDDVHFAGESNFLPLMGAMLLEYWYAVLLLAGLAALLVFGFKWIGYRVVKPKSLVIYYLSQVAILAVSAVGAVILIRGGVSAATYPMKVSDVTMYVSPDKGALVLSNPFAFIRTAGTELAVPRYFDEEECEAIFSPVHVPAVAAADSVVRPNVFIIILESFGAAHMKSVSDQFEPDAPSFTPFLDSLVNQGYLFANAYNNGARSTDALPAIWASIPSFDVQFLSMPQSVASYRALPAILSDKGYGSAFFHGSVRQSMGFVAFGKAVGVKEFYSREDYEKERGTNDFDGKWGIWDHCFLSYVAEKTALMKQPYLATLFTLSSHHPYLLPPGFEQKRYPEGKLPIQRAIAYSDDALRSFFAEIAKQPAFANTLFVITGDHASGADNEKYLKTPYNHAVPILLYYPGKVLNGQLLKGRDTAPANHIDIMPTLLGLLGNTEPYFAFGRDLFATPDGYSINSIQGTYDVVSDSLLYLFNGREVTGVYNYVSDPLQTQNLVSADSAADNAVLWTKAFLQQYYGRVSRKEYTVRSEKNETF